eukprot:1567377-Amphidinium_carterae.2
MKDLFKIAHIEVGGAEPDTPPFEDEKVEEADEVVCCMKYTVLEPRVVILAPKVFDPQAQHSDEEFGEGGNVEGLDVKVVEADCRDASTALQRRRDQPVHT